ncbi:3-hydroxyacyl-CoA dehydrogenase NAD-binding domain-containing protein [Aureimonas phyllosphaerae]|uniref:3-hydroxyacyl-CoA dehydrogenase/enoyl-CoA hydratase/3-hydroxybutyryl-CoA epimerase n=1 Tax=Aureimonas phyllosphaerae TaxID=1166078 RepID=A0A7W6BS48_9HYPH|nr:3-hydroxyacyl-CoA dehydrogenase NAD-binding domain-containing protein [Aureimonas phyllosphaerae]MBB3935004.1 3-hydroxyacyl-CoA dehydrogenase/enoyl-CoA hydratase/3-hydroxybutyryl-CoA epimerase [Aureimonas phyllosphaerae]MBB3959012.1 3-hydroxyacyl-CoA dehydrogenase/enoyl-CoA hydratase/3-hydroxybutyryl-CoA epimerase [Aureimonas phyllosphaerae]SFF39884.1 short chain enoyl-CoA hydratase /3-hydroxyacyl-CoA dehydrogenase [Aureimonas phyllosphaerae]
MKTEDLRMTGASLLDTLSDRALELSAAADVERRGNWRQAVDEDGVAWWVLDRPGKSVNTIDRSVLEELDALIDGADAAPPRGIVIRSAKPSGFAAGADIAQFVGAGSAEIASMLGEGHRVLDRLAALPLPTIAVIHGHCLGAGLELALACRLRIAVSDASLGFPEVMLGLHPGLGGTFRSLAVADPLEAMAMMLTGKSAPARRARRIGLVDAVVEERHVLNAVRAAVGGELHPAGTGWKGKAFALRPARSLAARRMRAEAAKAARPENYPAPFRLIDLWEAHGDNPNRMRAAELDSFSQLIETPTSRNLVRVFFLREAMRGLKDGPSGIRRVHVIGAGAMGGDIAAWAAREGFRVSLSDIDAKPIGEALRKAASMLEKTLKDKLKVRDALDRLVPDPAGFGIVGADLVIEAAPERLDLKQSILLDAEARMKPGAILATNTSALPLPDLAAGLADPSRFVGLHFFNPVSRMQLVEVVRHDGLSPETLRRATSFVAEISRLPAPVRPTAGFLVNRALTPYIAEAILLMGEGIPKERIDARAEAFGMPMGPVELADRVGLDIAVEVAQTLAERLGMPLPEMPGWLHQMVREGRLGVKTGAGLYDYDAQGKPKKIHPDALPDGSADDPALEDRLILPMVNTVVACLREGVVQSEEIADGAMVFGTGFAPFRGGPIRYARERGVDTVIARLRELEMAHGPRFRPDAGWDRI